MYVRSTTFRGDPNAVDDGIAYTRDKVLPAVRQIVTAHAGVDRIEDVVTKHA